MPHHWCCKTTNIRKPIKIHMGKNKSDNIITKCLFYCLECNKEVYPDDEGINCFIYHKFEIRERNK